MAKRPLADVRFAKLPFHPSLLIAPFALIFWVIAVAGAGATHNQCSKRDSDSSCNAQFGLVWATVFFEFGCLVALFGLLPTRFGSGVRVMLAALLTIPTTLFMGHAQDAIKYLDTIKSTTTTGLDMFGMVQAIKVSPPSDLKAAYQTAAAGSTMMVIINLVLVIYLLLEVPDCESCSSADATKPAKATPAVPAPAAEPVAATAMPPV